MELFICIKRDLALNNLQWLIYHKIQPNQTKPNQRYLMVFHLSLSDSKSSQISRTLFSILVNLNNIVWMLSIRPLISKSFSPCTIPLVTVPITIYITVTFMFHSFSVFLQDLGIYFSFQFLLGIIIIIAIKFMYI